MLEKFFKKQHADYEKITKVNRVTKIDGLNNMYLIPILNFSGLGISPEGYIINLSTNSPLITPNENKFLIMISDYKKYEFYLNNKDFCIPFNPYHNLKHLYDLMRFVQNAIFQTDSEFHEYFFETIQDPFTGDFIRQEKDIPVEQITQLAEKHIQFISLGPDYKGIIRLRWIITTNYKLEKIDKLLCEVVLPKTINQNVRIILSLHGIIEYYKYCGTRIIIKDDLNEALYFQDMISKITEDMKKNKVKHTKNLQTIKEEKEFSINENHFNKQEKDYEIQNRYFERNNSKTYEI